jgi:phosphoribosylformylglycinamidine synthase
MTECVYECTLQTFIPASYTPETIKVVPLLEKGRLALEEANQTMGLGFDEWDLDYYTKMFTETLQRNPTDVECFDLGQSNSEHSRHWFFGGKMIIDGEEKQGTLFSMVKATLPPASEPTNSVIAFHDNSSAIQGFPTVTLTPLDPTTSSALKANHLTLHPILTAETHNFPCGVAPFAGAETGTGGRLRDVQATGRGAHTLAGVSAYCVGNLHIPGNPFPWEEDVCYSSSLATPLEIIIEASNGASDYGNKYGEPVVSGFCRTFGQRRPGKDKEKGERVEWVKPIMFTAGAGWLDSRHSKKGEPEPGMVVCKVGGPAYRIGMGGGAASSRVQSSSSSTSTSSSSLANLDFNAVQRGDAEMENRMNRVIRACVEMGESNPIVSIHDQVHITTSHSHIPLSPSLLLLFI